ncbi:MAG: cytochrome c oxidase subunit [Candidatus Binatota bacterium]|jgi:cytochrome c oxidase subunit 2|nr:cytochrome c oxidase subunit [Candidatus Binatota bacterium]
MPERLFRFIPDQASTLAPAVDNLYFFLVALSAFFSILIAGLLIYFAVKFRRRPEHAIADEHGVVRGGQDPEHGAHGPALALEIAWTVIPLVIVLGIFFWSNRLFFLISRPPADAMEVFVVGKQWMWKVQHPEGQREINQLHVPVGRPVRLTMSSEDVIHSFFMPAFRVKMDVLPGRYTTAWFQATRPGTYPLYCAEYCGTLHSGMIGQIVVMHPDAYQAWLEGAPSGGQTLASAGEGLFKSFGCAACHLTDSPRGPRLAGAYGKPVSLEGGASAVADEGYLRESILNPQAKIVAGYPPIMPTFQGQVTEEQLIQLIAYVKSLGAEEGGAARSAQGASELRKD